MSGGAEDETGHARPHLAIFFCVVAMALGCLSRVALQRARSGLPFTVVLLAEGLALGLLRRYGAPHGELGVFGETIESAAHVDPHLVLHIFLPILIFESSFGVNFTVFKTIAPQALLLAVPGMLLATFFTGVIPVVIFNYGWGWSESLMLGAMLSATDPVAVVALLKDLGASKRLATLIEGESLLNDGTAIVVFNVMLDIFKGEHLTAGAVIGRFCRLALGGPVFGLAVAWLASRALMGIFNDGLVEISITLMIGFLLFFLSEEVLGVSGVLAVSTAGFYFAFQGWASISPDVEHTLHSFWHLVTFIGNTLIFVLTGVIIAERINFEGLDGRDVGYLFLLYALLHVARSLSVYMLAPALQHSGYGLSWRQSSILVYGGLRGAVSLVLALVVFQDDAIEQSVRDRVLFFSSGIATLTLVINATTVGWLLRSLGMTKRSVAKEEVLLANLERMDDLCSKQLKEIGKDKLYTGANFDVVRDLVTPVSYKNLKKTLREQVAAAKAPKKRDRRNVANADEHAWFYGTTSAAGTTTKGDSDSESTAHSSSSEEEDENVDNGLSVPIRRMDLTQEARVRFLSGVKAVYWELFEKGHVSREGVAMLMRSADDAKEHSQEEMDEWDRSFKFDVEIGFVDRVLNVVSRSRLPLLAKMADRTIVERVQLRVDVANAFITSHKQVLGSLGTIVKDRIARRQIEVESTKSVDIARSFVRAVDQNRPLLLTSIRTKQAAYLGLQWRRHFIEDMHHNGLLLEAESSMLLSQVEASLKRLAAHSPVCQPPEPKEVLRHCRLFHKVNPATVNRCIDETMELVEYWRGEKVMQRGHECPGMAVVTRGWATIKIRHRVDNWGTGITFGEIEGLANCPTVVTVRANSGLPHPDDREHAEAVGLNSLIGNSRMVLAEDSGYSKANLQVAIFDIPKIMDIAKEDKQLMTNITMLASFHITYLLRTTWKMAKSPMMRSVALSKEPATEIIRGIAAKSKVHKIAPGEEFVVRNLGILMMGTLNRPDGVDMEAISTAVASDIPYSAKTDVLMLDFGECEDDGAADEDAPAQLPRTATGVPLLMPDGDVRGVHHGDHHGAIERKQAEKKRDDTQVVASPPERGSAGPSYAGECSTHHARKCPKCMGQLPTARNPHQRPLRHIAESTDGMPDLTRLGSPIAEEKGSPHGPLVTAATDAAAGGPTASVALDIADSKEHHGGIEMREAGAANESTKKEEDALQGPDTPTVSDEVGRAAVAAARDLEQVPAS